MVKTQNSENRKLASLLTYLNTFQLCIKGIQLPEELHIIVNLIMLRLTQRWSHRYCSCWDMLRYHLWCCRGGSRSRLIGWCIIKGSVKWPWSTWWAWRAKVAAMWGGYTFIVTFIHLLPEKERKSYLFVYLVPLNFTWNYGVKRKRTGQSFWLRLKLLHFYHKAELFLSLRFYLNINILYKSKTL